MLKTSPVLTTSANASPTSFRYAPPSPQSSSKSASALRRRHSSRSVSDSHRLKYVAIDAAVQTSPMDDPPKDSARSHHDQPQLPQLPPTPAQPPPPPQHPPQSPCPQPMATSSSASSVEPLSQPPYTATATPQNAVSPTKRRSSPARAVNGQPAEAGPSKEKAPKRSKPDEKPPKVLPRRYELCAVEDMVELISHMLAELIATNDAIRISNGGLTRFHSRTAPGISVRDYLHRLARHATLTPPLLLAMVYYIDRLCAMYPEFTINTLTVHRFLITAATVAAKGLSDAFWNNTTYARVGGVRVAELKLLELEFLYRVDWKIVPNPEVLVAYYKGLVERTPGYTLEADGTEEDDEDDVEEDGDADE